MPVYPGALRFARDSPKIALPDPVLIVIAATGRILLRAHLPVEYL
jgi:hypothetical protein